MTTHVVDERDGGGERVCRLSITKEDSRDDDEDRIDQESAQEEDDEVAKVLSRVAGKALKAAHQSAGTSKLHPALINYTGSIGESVIIPSKQHVLQYFAGAQAFKLNKVGSELQITDASANPLFDVWLELDCCRCTWVIEAYGKVVMVMHEKPNTTAAGLLGKVCCCAPGARRGGNAAAGGRRRPPITLSDWNGDLFGYLVPGDPFLLQSPDRQTVARLVPHCAPAMCPSDTGGCLAASRASSCYNMAARQSADCAQCRCAECDAMMAAREGGAAAAVPLAVDTSLANAAAQHHAGVSPSPCQPPVGTSCGPAVDLQPGAPGLSWLCVSAAPAAIAASSNGRNGAQQQPPNGAGLQRQEETAMGLAAGRHIARLDGFDTILYNKDVTFQMKLLCLAAIIRLSAPWTMPKRGEAGLGGAWSAASSVLNCLAYCLF